MDPGRVSTFSSFCAEHMVNHVFVMGPWHLYLRSTRSEERTALFGHRPSPSSCKRRCRFQDGTVGSLGYAAKQGLQRIPPDWVAQDVTTFEYAFVFGDLELHGVPSRDPTHLAHASRTWLNMRG